MLGIRPTSAARVVANASLFEFDCLPSPLVAYGLRKDQSGGIESHLVALLVSMWASRAAAHWPAGVY
jgi:hypothetical protein